MGRAVAVAAGGLVLLGILAATTLLYVERATVVLAIPAQRVQARLALTGGPAEGDLPTQHLTVKVTDTLAGTASPAIVGSAYATGSVVFTYYSSCTKQPCGVSIRVLPGLDLYTNTGVHYVTLTDQWFQTTSPPVPVRAVLPGSSGNTAAGTIVNFGYNEAPGLVVTNPKPVSGGADRMSHVVLQSDFDTVNRAVAVEAIQDANRAMRLKAAGLAYGIVAPPKLTYTLSDPVGTETETFTVTMTATMEAYAFFDTAIRGHLQAAVMAKVRPDEQLTRDTITVDYRITSLTLDGEIHIEATGTGFVVPRISSQSMQAGVAGLDVSRARATLQSAVPGATATIELWPIGGPWMPVEPGNITIQVKALPAVA